MSSDRRGWCGKAVLYRHSGRTSANSFMSPWVSCGLTFGVWDPRLMVAILPSADLVFVHPPRTGGTSIEASLTQLAKDGDIVVGGVDGDLREEATAAKVVPGLHKHITLGEIRRLLPELLTQETRVVVSIRDPWGLLQSAWRFCLRQLVASPEAGALRLATVTTAVDQATWPFNFGPMRAALASIHVGGGLEGFLNHLLDDNQLVQELKQPRFFAGSWPTGQTFFVRLESNADDWERLGEAVGISLPPLPLLAPSFQNEEQDARNLPRSLQRRLEAHFGADFDVLGYAKPWPL